MKTLADLSVCCLLGAYALFWMLVFNYAHAATKDPALAKATEFYFTAYFFFMCPLQLFLIAVEHRYENEQKESI